MIHSNEIELEDVIQADPTLKFLIRDSSFVFDKLEHQTKIRGAAIVIAISKWLDKKI